MDNPYINHLNAMQEIYERDVFLRRDSRKAIVEQRPFRDEKYEGVNLIDEVRFEMQYQADKDIESRAESICNLGVGCVSGLCYAENVGCPEECGRKK